MPTTILALLAAAALIQPPGIRWVSARSFRISDAAYVTYSPDGAAGGWPHGRIHDLSHSFWINWHPAPVPEPPYARPCFHVIPADWDRDETVTSLDFFLFLRDYFEGLAPHPLNSEADWNGDGLIDSQDFFDYVDAFLQPS